MTGSNSSERVFDASGWRVAIVAARFNAGLVDQPAASAAELVAAVEAFEAAANTPGSYLEYRLQAAELLIVDNRRVLHARGLVPGGRSAGRHLKRVKAYRP